MAKFKIELHGEEGEVEVTRQGNTLHVSHNGSTAELQIMHEEGAAFLLEQLQTDGIRKRIRAAGHLKGDQRQIWVNGRTFNYQRMRQRGSTAVPTGSLSASIPAVVSQILVEVGDVVTAGDKLILLESMKMVIPIQAPHDGVVTAVHCKTSDSVEAGIPLLEIKKQDSDVSP